MADLSDVELTLTGIVTRALYPNGLSSASVVGGDCRIYRGWPLPTTLTNDLRKGTVNVSVFPSVDAGLLTTRFTDAQAASGLPLTLTYAVSDNAVTFGGTASPGQLAGLLVDGQTYAYAVQVGDTTASVAANLASAARADHIVTLSGASLAIPSAGRLVVRVVSSATWQQEVRRQARSFHVACWCPSPRTRDNIAIAIDQLFAGMNFIPFSEGTFGRITYEGTTVTDRGEDVLLYRRDLIYKVEYPTIAIITQPEMLFGDLTMNTSQIVT